MTNLLFQPTTDKEEAIPEEHPQENGCLSLQKASGYLKDY